ncbi:MAG: dipeptide/oligopeptide/nickel ABC transporter permease/ATP-binding protein [Bifidobacteriaceae bacterium]|jgi:ABC-type dipeptide/oligopeptide/nickel transport system ATPase component/ABC-type dipeptide/oligopeptide/nickel transport system permease subunit|nr:dipeptide/oligopeptide/nickel ABC transporter permease/ATP-binding protein [Bifidobacteriaceae bacterium]
MSTVAVPAVPLEVLAEAPAGKVSLLRRLLRNPIGVTCLGYLVLLALVAVFGRLMAPQDPDRADPGNFLASPSAEHLMGTDSTGRDVLSRLLAATQISVAAALLATVIAVVLGVVTGLIAGYFGGWFDSISSWIAGLLMAMPGFVVLLAARAVIGPTVWMAMVVFGVLMAPGFFRLVYAAVTAVRNELYVDAARVAGLSDARIIGRHIMSVVRAPIIIQAAMAAGIAVAIQAGLDFLGLGDLGVASWGAMLNDGFAKIYNQPILMLWPSLAIALTCIALTLLANALRDELERAGAAPKRKKKAGAARDDGDVIIQAADVIVHGADAHSQALTGEVLLDVHHLRVGYDQPDGSVTEVVHGIDLRVHRGSIHGLIGESGSGKTQTAFAIMGLLPAGGRVLEGASIMFAGQELAGGSEALYRGILGKRIAYIPQEPMSNLDPSFTVGSQLTEPMRLALGLKRAQAKQRALDLLDRVGIPDPARTFAAYPHEISGGMAQRVLIAGAVSLDPQLLIADEPTTALDVTVQAEVLELIRDLQTELNLGVLLVTHNFGVVADLCDQVSVMQRGLIVEAGPVRAIFHDAQHPYTQSLLDAILDDAAPRGPLGADREEVAP